jgi:cytosine/creatinine deaminase
MSEKLWSPWSPRSHFQALTMQLGGLANHHAHFDKAGLIQPNNIDLGRMDLKTKWELVRSLKKTLTRRDFVDRISWCIEKMIEQKVTYCRSMIDVDGSTQLRAIEAALEVRRDYVGKIKLEFSAQPHEGLIDQSTGQVDRELHALYTEGCRLADWCGALPSRDRPYSDKHLDIVLSLARELGKPAEAQIDQENSPFENETELLADKTIEHQMEGQAYGVHAVSLAAKSVDEQDRIIGKIIDANIGVVICPSAALSMEPLPWPAPLHNSIAPLSKLLEKGVRCYLGTDNIHDFHMPIADGDIWTECRIAMEACRFYDIDAIAQWACRLPLPIRTGP